jgi:hypothetical protein
MIRTKKSSKASRHLIDKVNIMNQWLFDLQHEWESSFITWCEVLYPSM